MNAPSDALQGSYQSTVALTEEGGKFKASCPSLPDLPPVVRTTAGAAVNDMTKAVRNHIERGFKK